MDKEKFISELKNGNEEAYNELIQLYSKRLYYLCLKFLGNDADAQDAVQITFLKVFRGINNFEYRSELSTWIYKIAVNSCNDLLRRRKREHSVSLMTANDEHTEDFYYKIADENENVEEEVLRKERKQIVYKCIYSLPYIQRQFIVLRDLEGLPYAEIAKILNLNIGTVKSGINRARGKLIKLIKEYEKERGTE